MSRPISTLAGLVAAWLLLAFSGEARAQEPPFGSSPIVVTPARPVPVAPPPVAKPRRATRNRFFARRPAYSSLPPVGPRSHFEPYTRFYFPKGETYPPLAPSRTARP